MTVVSAPGGPPRANRSRKGIMATETKIETTLWERFTEKVGAITEGVVGFLGRLFGSSNERIIRALGYIRRRQTDAHTVIPGSHLAQVNELEPLMLTLTDAALKDLTRHFRLCLAGKYEPARYVKKPVPPDPDAVTPDAAAEEQEADDGEETTPSFEPEYILDL